MFIREGVLYGLASLAAFLVDYSFLYLLFHWFGLPYLLCVVLGFLLGCLLLYKICVKWIFQGKQNGRNIGEFGLFSLIGIVGLILNVAIVAVGVEIFGLYLLLAKLAASGCTLIFNFFFRRWLLSCSAVGVELHG